MTGHQHARDAAGAEADDRFVGTRNLTRWDTAPGRLAADLAHRLAGVFGSYSVPVVTLLLGAGLAAALATGSAEIYEAVSQADGVAAFDAPVLHVAMLLRTPELNAAVTAFTHLGGPIGMPILAALATVSLAVWRRRITPVLLMVAAAAGSLAMTVHGKELVGRIRPPAVHAVPPLESSASFPSGHALNAVVVSGVLVYLLILRQHRWRTRAATIVGFAVFAAAMGLSRVYLGHHWLTDVLVGWTLGLGWLVVIIVAHRLYLTVWHLRPVEHVEGPPKP